MNLRRVISGLQVLALLVLVGPVVAYAAAVFAPGTAGYVVTSGSMEPTVSTGSIVFVAEGTYERNDVVSYERDGQIVTHRIVELTDGGYVTKGDANPTADDRIVPADDVVGEVVLTLPYYGTLISIAGTPVGYVLLVLVPGGS